MIRITKLPAGWTWTSINASTVYLAPPIFKVPPPGHLRLVA